MDGPILFLCSGPLIRHGTNIDGRRRVYCEMKALVYTGIETLKCAMLLIQTLVQMNALFASKVLGFVDQMAAYLGHDDRRPAPIILGHEVAGVVEGGT